jgi:hypothetical protein
MKPLLFMTAVALASASWLAAPLAGAQGASAAKAGDQTITVTGCIQREADYRKAHDKGKGGVVGTGVGVENEFVLTNLKPGVADAAKSGMPAGPAYELTGANEKLAGPHVNHRVEITGILKAADVSASGKPTGGASAGAPPRGVDVVSKDLQLRELEVTTLKMISADCPKM